METTLNPNHATLIHNYSPEQITNLFRDLKNEILELKNNFQSKEPSEYLTRSEVSKLFKCDLSTVHNWTKSGKLKAYGIGNRVYYKRSEVESVLIPFNSNHA